MSAYKRINAVGKRAKTPKELMNQGVSPAIEKVEPSVKALLKQGNAPKFAGHGKDSVKTLMRQ
jgi:hypothetical protein